MNKYICLYTFGSITFICVYVLYDDLEKKDIFSIMYLTEVIGFAHAGLDLIGIHLLQPPCC